MDDIPKGQFVCTYAGHLITEDESDIRAIESGDEYFAELDFVECLRKLKEGFTLSLNGVAQEEDLNSNDSNNQISTIKTEQLNQVRVMPRKNRILIKTQNTEIDVIFLDSDEDEQGN